MILTLIPIVFFGGGLLAIFAFFLLGVLSFFFTEDKEKSSQIILKSLVYLFIFLIIFLIFAVVSYLLKNGELLKPQKPSEPGIPASPMGDFPPPAEFIEIGQYNFAGPWQLKEKDEKIDSVVFALLCKNEKDYDIIDIGITDGRKKVSQNANYACWQENCLGNKNNLYIAFYWLPKEGFNQSHKNNIVKEIKKEINPPCAEKL